MNSLKFELSVLFTKKEDIHYLSGNDIIKEEYQKFFGKEVKDEDLAKIIEEIVQDQISFGNAEIPEDFEINKYE